MGKYYACYFCTFEELQAELKKVTKKQEALEIVQSLEVRGCLSYWIRAAYNKYYELAGL